MRVVFMGTPDFAAKCLQALTESHHEVIAVVTQPDRPSGRGKKLVLSPVKEYALKMGLTVLQPEKIRSADNLPPADIFVVAAYGKILPQRLLGMPKYGAINVHASLLPKYRGASPIQQAIANGDTVTGITIQQMDAGIDTGDMLLKREVPIDPNDTGGTLHDKLCIAAREALTEALDLIESGTARPISQDDALATYAPLITKEMAHIDWRKSTVEIVNMIRAYNPFPGAFTRYGEEQIKVWKGEVVETCSVDMPGKILKACPKDGIYVAANEGVVRLAELTPPNGKRMTAADFVKGYRIEAGGGFL